jgi:vacuolar-type H+-ATPase subunit I/STV1
MSIIISSAKKHWRYILITIIALTIGTAAGPSQEELDVALNTNQEKDEKIEEMENSYQTAEDKIEELEAKVAEAKPWFELSELERANRQEEAKLKEAELAKQKKQEEERAAKEQAEKEAAEAREAEKKRAQELAARTKTLSAGKYVVGRDLPAGLYNANAVRGDGNFVVSGSGTFSLKVNEMFGVSGGFYNNSFNNLELEDGDEIEINNNLQVKFVPID